MAIFQYNDYRSYIKEALAKKGRGSRADLAKALNCQVSFISQVLSERTNFSLEHAILIADFFELNGNDERRYLLLLVQYERAGSSRLKTFFHKEISDMKMNREQIKDEIGVIDKLSPSDHAIYYNNWWYSAIHIISALETEVTRELMQKRFRISSTNLDAALNFLINCGLIKKKQGRFVIGKKRIHLGSRSPLIARHHSNWRQRVLQIYDQDDLTQSNHLHYSGVFALSGQDAERMHSMLVKMIKESERILKGSPEELCQSLLIDWFPT